MAIIPALRNFIIQRGSDWRETRIYYNRSLDGESKTKMDLTGFTVLATAWDEERFLKYCDFNVVYDDRPNGQFTLKAPKETTEHFPDVLEYDVKLIDPDGNEEFYEEGRINVSEGYTR
tara:strand:+ start:573 stop:926 length:354 start_codon:yes stop_codon:yes gene_type:complete